MVENRSFVWVYVVNKEATASNGIKCNFSACRFKSIEWIGARNFVVQCTLCGIILITVIHRVLVRNIYHSLLFVSSFLTCGKTSTVEHGCNPINGALFHLPFLLPLAENSFNGLRMDTFHQRSHIRSADSFNWEIASFGAHEYRLIRKTTRSKLVCD